MRCVLVVILLLLNGLTDFSVFCTYGVTCMVSDLVPVVQALLSFELIGAVFSLIRSHEVEGPAA